MLFAIALIVAVVAAAGLFTLAVLSRRDKPAGRYRARPMQVAVRTVRPSVLPRAADPESVSDGVVFVRPMGEGQALVLGQSADLDVIGTTVSALPENIARGLTQGNAALQAAVGAGAASGRLVMLTQESAAALKAMGPIKDSSGAVLGVVRDGSGKFSNVLRFTQADKLATLASLGPALSGIALQMQLAAISRKLDGIQQSVDRIEQNQDDELASSVETNLALAMRDYAQLQQTGVISDTHWALIASRSKSVEDNVRQIGKQMNRLVDQLVAVAGKKGGIRAGERLERLDRFNNVDPLPSSSFTSEPSKQSYSGNCCTSIALCPRMTLTWKFTAQHARSGPGPPLLKPTLGSVLSIRQSWLQATVTPAPRGTRPQPGSTTTMLS